MPASDKKLLRRILRAAVEQGARVEVTSNGHYKILPADRSLGFVTLPATPSDHRSLRNSTARLRRIGIAVKP